MIWRLLLVLQSVFENGHRSMLATAALCRTKPGISGIRTKQYGRQVVSTEISEPV